MSAKNKQDTILRLLFWESTIRCNLNCVHCRRIESNEAAFKDATTEQGWSLIEQLSQIGRDQGSRPILVFSGGEPLCREDIFELVRLAKDKQIIPALATNATLIDEEIAGQIKTSGVSRVAVSVDGATAEVHNKLRKMPGSFEKAIEGINCIRGEGIPYQINITLTRHNFHQLDKVYELGLSLGASALHIFMLVPVGCGQLLKEEDMLSSEQYEEILKHICRLDRAGKLSVKVTCGPHYQRVIRQEGLYQQRNRENPRDELSGHRAMSKGCLAGLGVLFVGHQGDVFPCGYLPVNCGNVFETSLADIWKNNPELARMRNAAELKGKCGLCGYREVCGGCRARAYAATGDYMAEEPFCVYVPPRTRS